MYTIDPFSMGRDLIIESFPGYELSYIIEILEKIDLNNLQTQILILSSNNDTATAIK